MMNSEVESLIDALSPFKNAVEILCAEKCPALNKALVTLAKIKITLKTFCKNPLVRKVIAKLYEGLSMRAKSDEETHPLQQCLV